MGEINNNIELEVYKGYEAFSFVNRLTISKC